MRTYNEVIHKIALGRFSNEMGGGYGQARGQDMVSFIYEVPYIDVIEDVIKEYKKIQNEYYDKQSKRAK